jgi:hypothetical protein
VHGDDYTRPDLLYGPLQIYEFDGRWSPGQGQKDVYFLAHFIEEYRRRRKAHDIEKAIVIMSGEFYR